MKAPTGAATLPCSSSPWPLRCQHNIGPGGKEQPVAYNKGSFSLQGSPESDYFGRAAHTKGLRHIPELPPALSTEKQVPVKTSPNLKAFCLGGRDGTVLSGNAERQNWGGRAPTA